MKTHQRIIKRLMDITLSILGLNLSSPLFFLIALFIKIDSKGLVLFRQQRLGKGSKPFTCYKFRTMYVDAPDIRNLDGSSFSAVDNPRVTRVGRFLRKITLDELPQFINVCSVELAPNSLCTWRLPEKYIEPNVATTVCKVVLGYHQPTDLKAQLRMLCTRSLASATTMTLTVEEEKKEAVV
jgi:hypothetical protein